MINLINGSVGKEVKGKKAINNKTDVYIVQELLNLYADAYLGLPKVKVDGFSGPHTENAIKAFQIEVAGFRHPDSRIDNPGTTERIMSENLNQITVKTIVSKYRPVIITTPDFHYISYRANARHDVSKYSENLIKWCMKIARLERLDFSSTRRSVIDQARVMYQNCKKYNSYTALRASRTWNYGIAGSTVEKYYYANTDKPEMDVRKEMEEKIQQYLNKNVYTSRHCVNIGEYHTYNVIDIPYSSIKNLTLRKALRNAICSMSNIVVDKMNDPFTGKQQYEYFNKIIIEEFCFHIEIPQNPTNPGIKSALAKTFSKNNVYI